MKKNYILKLATTGTNNYRLHDGSSFVSDTNLTSLFSTAGSAYFSFDFDNKTPASLTTVVVVKSNNTTAVLTNTNLPAISEQKDYEGVWANSATRFTSLDELTGKAVDDAQISFLMRQIKNAELRDIEEFPYDVQLKDLPTGAYTFKRYQLSGGHRIKHASVTVGSSTFSSSIITYGSVLIVAKQLSGNALNTYGLFLGPNAGSLYPPHIIRDTGTATGQIFMISEPVNNLKSTSDYSALAAAQGVILNGYIQDLACSISKFNNLWENA